MDMRITPSPDGPSERDPLDYGWPVVPTVADHDGVRVWLAGSRLRSSGSERQAMVLGHYDSAEQAVGATDDGLLLIITRPDGELGAFSSHITEHAPDIADRTPNDGELLLDLAGSGHLTAPVTDGRRWLAQIAVGDGSDRYWLTVVGPGAAAPDELRLSLTDVSVFAAGRQDMLRLLMEDGE